MISAELDGQASLLDAEAPADWPLEHHDHGPLMFWHEQLSQRRAQPAHYVVLADSARPTLVGFTGSPVNGVVEISNSVVPSLRRLGSRRRAVVC